LKALDDAAIEEQHVELERPDNDGITREPNDKDLGAILPRSVF